jgi:hypothetical protein
MRLQGEAIVPRLTKQDREDLARGRGIREDWERRRELEKQEQQLCHQGKLTNGRMCGHCERCYDVMEERINRPA